MSKTDEDHLAHRPRVDLPVDHLLVRTRGHLARTLGTKLIDLFLEVLEHRRHLQDHLVSLIVGGRFGGLLLDAAVMEALLVPRDLGRGATISGSTGLAFGPWPS